MTLVEQVVGTSSSENAILAQGVYVETNQTLEVRSASGDVFGSVELDGDVSDGPVTVPSTRRRAGTRRHS
jgi:hypothetical protein